MLRKVTSSGRDAPGFIRGEYVKEDLALSKD